MTEFKAKSIVPLLACGLISGLALAAPGCGEGGLIDQCGLNCDASILDGQASISGVASVDAFFGAVVDLSTAANDISATLRAELDAIALSVGLEPGATGAEISAAIETKLAGYIDVDAGLSIEYQEPVCEANVEVTAAAAAECDVEVDPGMASVECSGACEVEGGVMASCEGDATLKCTGQAPEFSCMGTCEGSCELEFAAECSGTCRGTCMGDCSVTDASGSCAGACDGDCQGTCELEAGGECGGMCTGSCTYEPASGSCEAGASAKCEASADASVTCEGKCEGEFEPPEVSAECEATVEAKADASLECKPPSIGVTWQWNAQAEADTDAGVQLRAEFKSWIQGFKGHLAVMFAAQAKADILVDALGNLGDAGVAAIRGGGEAIAGGNLAATYKITTCAFAELENVGTVIGDATGSLQAEVSASVDVFAAVGL